ncbi:MAG: GntR family transcriptional regulator [Synergistales bacterium]|nr:GntR family transcriptional regulator [Synergistales bacterium]
MTANPLSPAENQDLRQIVHDKVREAILDGHFLPGERLSEVELAEQLNVSRTPVREAIRQLAQTGIIELRPRKGAFVALLSIKDVNDLYELRSALELMAVQDICKNPPREELMKMHHVFSSMDNTTDPQYFLEEDSRFHRLLRGGSGNRFLEKALTNVFDLIQLCRLYSIAETSIERSLEEHKCIIDAVLQQDSRKATDALQNHLNYFRESLISYLNKHPEFTRGRRAS